MTTPPEKTIAERIASLHTNRDWQIRLDIADEILSDQQALLREALVLLCSTWDNQADWHAQMTAYRHKLNTALGETE